MSAPSLLLGACTALPTSPPSTFVAAPACATASARISFDFESASQSRCVIEGERDFTILVSPEHAPPINPSPWYAFRYSIEPGEDVAIGLEYLEGRHRYVPKREAAGASEPLTVTQSDVGNRATFSLAPGTGRISAQEIFDSARYDRTILKLQRLPLFQLVELGHSLEGRPIEGLRMGRKDAPNLIVLLGRAHPPEVSGAVAMEAFMNELAAIYEEGGLDPHILQVLAVPQLNPDGVARGHWRANLGGVDLNRDWGVFSQPETSSVAKWLNELEPTISPMAMIDFHSTRKNLFYVQGADETDLNQERFLQQWLGSELNRVEGYPFTIERRNANPDSGTAKNWFHAQYGIPSYTYEVADEADREVVSSAARILARALPAAIRGSLLSAGKGK